MKNIITYQKLYDPLKRNSEDEENLTNWVQLEKSQVDDQCSAKLVARKRMSLVRNQQTLLSRES